MLRIINHRPRLNQQNISKIPVIGSCVEINAPSANILCDAGVFFPGDKEFIDVLAPRKQWQPGIDYPVLAGEHYYCFLSHGHTDHYAGLFALNPAFSVDVYAGDLTWRILNHTPTLLKSKLKDNFSRLDIRHIGTFEHAKPINIDGYRIIPIKVQHNIPDCWAFIIECCGIRLLYALEFMDRFWIREEETIANIDIAVIGYMPDIASEYYVKFSNIKYVLQNLERDHLIFYVTPGENIESIESCFQYFNGLTFISPYVNNFLSLLSEDLKKEFTLINKSPIFDKRNIPAELGLVACNFAEFMRFLDGLEIDAGKLYIISNDYGLSTFARSIKDDGQSSQHKKIIGELKKRGQLADAFESAHGSQKVVRELLSHLLDYRNQIKVMVTHTIDSKSLFDTFGDRIELIDEFYL